MTPLLAKVSVPWPLIVFAVVVTFQVLAGAFQQWLRSSRRREEAERAAPEVSIPEAPEPWLAPTLPRSTEYPELRRSPPTLPPPMTDAERAARLERILRGTARVKEAPPVVVATNQPREFEPTPSGTWVTLDESAEAMRHASQQLAKADALATMSLTPMSEASAAMQEATDQLNQGDQAIYHPAVLRAVETPRRDAPTGYAADLARTLRDPATARGAIIVSVLLGRPKALEE